MIVPWMVYAIVSALLLGLAARSLEGVVRQRERPIRWLWLAALVGSALLPPLAFVVPGSDPAASEAAPLLPLPASIPAVSPVEWFTPAEPVAAASGPAVAVDALLLRGWALASLALLCCVLASHGRLLRRRRGWSPRTIEGREVWVSADTGPAVIGLVRGFIVVPDWVLEREPEEVEMVVAHEAEHLRAGDPRLLLAAMLLLVACPWNPALWWQWRRLRQAVEVDCDLRVLARGLDRHRYSRLLLCVAERGSAHRLVLASLAESRSLLERRIEVMVARPPRRWLGRAALAAVLACALVTAACRMDRPGALVSGARAASLAVAGTTEVPTDDPSIARTPAFVALADRTESEAERPSAIPPATGQPGVVEEAAQLQPAQQQPIVYQVTTAVPGWEVTIQASGAAAIETSAFRVEGIRTNGTGMRVRTPFTMTFPPSAEPLVVAVFGGGEMLEFATAGPGGETRLRAGGLRFARETAGAPLHILFGETPNVLRAPAVDLRDADAGLGVVRGTVTSADGRPLAGASVAAAGTTRGDQTDARGIFTITRVPPGTRTLRATFPGYREGTRSVVVVAGDTVAISIELSNDVGLRPRFLVPERDRSFPPERFVANQER